MKHIEDSSNWLHREITIRDMRLVQGCSHGCLDVRVFLRLTGSETWLEFATYCEYRVLTTECDDCPSVSWLILKIDLAALIMLRAGPEPDHGI